MAKERLKSPRARLFVALDLPGEVRARLVAWGEQELTDPALRRIAPESLHVTLCFIGHLAEKRIEEIGGIVRGLTGRPVAMTLAPVPAGKPRRRPRFFAFDIDSIAAVELQAELEERLVAARAWTPERRPFWPHLTVAKVRPVRGTRRPRPVAKPPGELPADLVHTFDSVRVSLYRSTLLPDGARYLSLASLDLPPTLDAGRRRGDEGDD